MSDKSSSKRYREYFIESNDGQAFMLSLDSLIQSQHAKAEDTTSKDESFAYTQRAKGIREVIVTINSLTTEAKKSTNNSK